MEDQQLVHMESIRKREVVSSVTLSIAALFLIIAVALANDLWQSPFADAKQLFVGAALIESEAPKEAVVPALMPHMLRIHTLDLQADFVRLGLTKDGSAEVPESFNEVGWYIHGPVPGEIGAAVILGHVDSYAGPAIFYDLNELKRNDTIDVVREDGSIAIFRVTESRVYDQSVFPTELVYGDVDYAALRLVTCTGVYDREEKRYSHNLVVYAELLDIVQGSSRSSKV